MTLDPISIATGGYVCGAGPDDIAVAADGYVCFALDEEIGGGSGGVSATREGKQPHGSYVPVERIHSDIDDRIVYDDAELAVLAIILIQEYWD